VPCRNSNDQQHTLVVWATGRLVLRPLCGLPAHARPPSGAASVGFGRNSGRTAVGVTQYGGTGTFRVPEQYKGSSPGPLPGGAAAVVIAQLADAQASAFQFVEGILRHVCAAFGALSDGGVREVTLVGAPGAPLERHLPECPWGGPSGLRDPHRDAAGVGP